MNDLPSSASDALFALLGPTDELAEQLGRASAILPRLLDPDLARRALAAAGVALDPSREGVAAEVFPRWATRLFTGPFDATYVGLREAEVVRMRGLLPRPEDAIAAHLTFLRACCRLIQKEFGPDAGPLLDAVLRVAAFDLSISVRHAGEQHAAEVAEAEAVQRRVFAAVPAGLAVVGADLRVRSVNPALASMAGADVGDLVGRALGTIFASEELEGFVARVLENGLPLDRVDVGMQGAGPRRPVRLALRQLAAGSEPGVLIIAADLAEEERLRAAAHEYERRLQELVERAADGVVLVDQQGRLTYLNAAGERMFGYRRAELMGVDARTILPDGFFTAGDRHLARRVARGDTLGRTPVRSMRGRRKDGTAVPVEGSLAAWSAGDPGDEAGVVYSGVLRDVSVRRKAEEALRRSEASFRALIENSPDGVGIYRDLRFVYANPALLEILKYAQLEDLIGRPVLELVHTEDRDVVAERLRHLVLGTGAGPARETRMLRSDGSVVWVEVVTLSVIYDGAPAVVSIARDVTERKLIQGRVAQADRMMSVGTLAAGVAHEINNPLTYVITNLGFVFRELTEIQDALRAAGPAVDPSVHERLAEVRQALAEARDGTDRVRVIVRDLKTFSRANDDRRGRIDVRNVLESSIGMARNHINVAARLVKDYHDVPVVDANEARLGQVFLNLLINAAQAIPEGFASRNEIRVTTDVAPDGRVRVEIRDTGSGIAPEHRSRLFDPFFTTKPVGVGTGLGLAVCMGIVSALGGDIEVESEVGRGSVFRVLLPAADADTGPKGVAIVPEPAPRRGRILVVDDEPSICAAVLRALRGEHDVASCSNARDALRRLVSGEQYELILCDVMMPEMTGMDLYATVEKMMPGVAGRIVFLTGGAFTPRAKAFLDQVPNARLDKPFQEEELLLFVRDRLG